MRLHRKKAHAFCFLFAVLLAGALPTVRAQEEAKETEEEEPKKFGSFAVLLESWIAQPAGLNYEPAVEVDPSSPFSRRVLEVGHGTSDEVRTQVDWDLPNKLGRLAFSYYAHSDRSPLSELRPGEFVFGETLTHPLLAGVNNDVLADGFSAETRTTLRDSRVDFYRPAFETSRAVGEWFVGWRRVEHTRLANSTYYAILPGIPALVPPLTQPKPFLDPLPDFAEIASDYSGRGAEAGLRVAFPLLRDKLTLDSSVSLTVMRGQADTSYRAVNSFYFCDTPPFETLPEFPDVPNCEPGIILTAPYDEFGARIDTNVEPPVSVQPLANFITQQQVGFGLDAGARSQTSQVLDTYIGFKYKALRWLEVVAGFRNTHYMNVGVDVRPRATTLQPSGEFDLLTTVDVETQDRSVTYEGFYGGVRIRIY